MTDFTHDLLALIEAELAQLHDARVLAHVRSLLVPPRLEQRDWDYGAPGEAYPCWMVLEDPSWNIGIAHCSQGFGPRHPWGLLHLKGEFMSMGMDTNWAPRFLNAYFESQMATDLPIWRVFRRPPEEAFPGTPISAPGSWDATWAEVNRLQALHPELRFDCQQSVHVWW